MSKRHKRNESGIVYSTNENYEYRNEDLEDNRASLPPEEQHLKIWRDRRHRGGKTVTIIKGFVGTGADLKVLGKALRRKCSAGGSIKDGEILIQGDHRDQVVEILRQMGFDAKQAGG